jgi:hypothetical protein
MLHILMASNIDDKQRSQSSAEPPVAGRTDQHSILAAAHKTVHGPAASDRLASIGGLEVSVGDTPPADDASATDAASALIPGAREGNTLTYREAGSIGGLFTGADIPAGASPWLDEQTARDRRGEGGGREGVHDTPQKGEHGDGGKQEQRRRG